MGKMCRTLTLTGACTDPDCKYAHGWEQLLETTAEVRRSRGMCKFWHRGFCHLGDRCTHAHEVLKAKGPSSHAVPMPVAGPTDVIDGVQPNPRNRGMLVPPPRH